MQNPEQDLYAEQWYVTGLGRLTTRQYQEAVSYLGELGLNIEPAELKFDIPEFLITLRALSRHALDTSIDLADAGRAWSALTCTQESHLEPIQAAGAEPLALFNRTHIK